MSVMSDDERDALMDLIADPDAVWPEDALSEDEWMAGWFDRQLIMGRLIEAQRPFYDQSFGGTR